MKIEEIMTREPVCASIDSSIQEVSDKMYGASVHHIPVVEEGKLVGIVSDRDIRSYLVPRDVAAMDPDFRQRLGKPVRSILRKDVLYVRPDAEVPEAIELMISEEVGALPVVKGTDLQVCGIVSEADILRAARHFF